MAYICRGLIKPAEFYHMFPEDKPANFVEEDLATYEIRDDLRIEEREDLMQHFRTIEAHRYYQFTMCIYKA